MSEQRHRRLITKKIDRHSATFSTGTGGFRSGPAHPSLGQVLGISPTPDRHGGGGYGSGSSGIGNGGSAAGNGQAGAGLTFSDFLDALALVSKVRRSYHAIRFHARLFCLSATSLSRQVAFKPTHEATASGPVEAFTVLIPYLLTPPVFEQACRGVIGDVIDEFCHEQEVRDWGEGKGGVGGTKPCTDLCIVFDHAGPRPDAKIP